MIFFQTVTVCLKQTGEHAGFVFIATQINSLYKINITRNKARKLCLENGHVHENNM